MAEDKKVYRLQTLKIEMQGYGDHKGKYLGNITFRNGDYESFTFNITPEMVQPYIDLIAAEIVKSADNLGADLKKSLGLDLEN
jgi:hypothetical protein